MQGRIQQLGPVQDWPLDDLKRLVMDNFSKYAGAGQQGGGGQRWSAEAKKIVREVVERHKGASTSVPKLVVSGDNGGSSAQMRTRPYPLASTHTPCEPFLLPGQGARGAAEEGV